MIELSKEEFRIALLKGMCECAERIHEYYEFGTSVTAIHFNGACPESFKPGVADKYLFNKFIDEVIDLVPKSYMIRGNSRLMAVKIMNSYYYSNYDPNFKSEKDNSSLIMKVLGN